ncbi:MAG: hypothetical protein IKY84_06925 [Bacteroidaceae bacterium]|nr:hypothetical protein [Bacteroidaceae bacterium]
MANINIYGTLHNATGDPIARANQIKDDNLQKTQQELNAMFNEGKNKDGVQIGKTYTAATDGGLTLDGNSFSLSPGIKSEIGCRNVTLMYGQNEDALTLALMRHNMKLSSIKVQGVASVNISYGDTLQREIYPAIPEQSIDMGSADFMVIKITRDADNADAVVGLKFNF